VTVRVRSTVIVIGKLQVSVSVNGARCSVVVLLLGAAAAAVPAVRTAAAAMASVVVRYLFLSSPSVVAVSRHKRLSLGGHP
jgi:hypothetical protein